MDLPGGRLKKPSRCRLCLNAYTKQWRKDNLEKSRKLGLLSHYRRMKKDPAKYGFLRGLGLLRKTVTAPPVLRGGWPDAGRVEEKIATDHIGITQWIRFAWLKRYQHIDVQILWALTHEDSVSGNGVIFESIEEYINCFKNDEARQLWRTLLKRVPKK